MLPTAAALFERVPRFFRRHKLMRAWMWLKREDPLQLVRIRENAFGYADLSDGFLRLIVIEGQYEKDFFRIGDALLQEGGVFFDVGANHGLLSLGLARKLDDRVQFHLFEPNPGLQESIRKSLELYPSMQARINSEAVSDHDGTVQIYFQEGQLGISHVVENGGVPVRSMKLDTYLTLQQVDRVDFLKMDIEGYELAALRGTENALKARRIKAIYFEYCEKWLSRHHSPQELLDYLESLAYAVCFCRSADIATQGGATSTLIAGLPGHSLPLVPIQGRQVPSTTDLLAIPRENLTSI
jgi:FkbM family methyltransferase